MRRIPFKAALAAVALLAFALRVAYAQLAPDAGGPGDDQWYHLMANALANGHFFTVPLDGLDGRGSFSDYSGTTVPTAFHPPLFPLVLSVASKLGVTGYDAHRVIGCAMGAGTVAVIGVVGRRLGGAVLGLTAAGLAAVYLPLIANDSALMTESLSGLMIALTILAAYRLQDRPSWQRAAVLGVAIGLSTLARAEALLLLVLLVPFAARRVGGRPLVNAGVAVLAAVVVIAPWCIRNTLAFDRPTGISTADGGVVAGANTPSTYHGDRIGTFDLNGLAIAPVRGPDRYNDSLSNNRLRKKGWSYAGDHAGRLPVVAAVRVLRTWSVYPFDPAAKVNYTALIERRRPTAEWLTMLSAWGVFLLAVGGIVVLRRRGAWLAPLLAPLVLVTVVSALFYGDVRFRQPADVSLVLLAAPALVALAARARPSAARSPAATAH